MQTRVAISQLKNSEYTGSQKTDTMCLQYFIITKDTLLHSFINVLM